ncbi:MarR family transcriptional regulator [Demequina sp. TTPB684]|uniref:MarR family winged helix-turn-helix transcriptional regulator n=1 Tax=unclassified Demequina TaxID=2620311 RepID=UPI001CF20813|nr:MULTISPECIES: MarR family transcriptional regulator [unclassified Demequina]MCB2413803.1 MarR family transcriptional regulator [Demequina sp. TTPB684]UPU89289.1 MarR family transcriptional regulator [Demequina sp. TMPB413]
MELTPGSDVALFRALHLATRQVTVGVERHLQSAAGISLSEYEILSALVTSPDQRARPREIGDMLGWEKSRTSHQITRMEKRGLLRRIDCDADLRGTWVTLTDAGARAALVAEPAYVEAIGSELSHVATQEERAAIANQLIEIGRDAAPESCQGEVAALEASLRPAASTT